MKKTQRKHIISNALIKAQFINAATLSDDLPFLKNEVQYKKFCYDRIYYDVKQVCTTTLNTPDIRDSIYEAGVLEKDEVPIVTEPSGGNDMYAFSFKPSDYFNLVLGKDRTKADTRAAKERLLSFWQSGAPNIPMPTADGKKIIMGQPIVIHLYFDKKEVVPETASKYLLNLAQQNPKILEDETKFQDIINSFIWQKIRQIKIYVHKNLLIYGESREVKQRLNKGLAKKDRIKNGFFQNVPPEFFINERRYLNAHFTSLEAKFKDEFDKLGDEAKLREEDLEKGKQAIDTWSRQFKRKVQPNLLIQIDNIREYLNIHDTHPEKTEILLDFEEFIKNSFFQYWEETESGTDTHRKENELAIIHAVIFFIKEELTNALYGKRNGADCIPFSFKVTRGGNFKTIKTITFEVIRPNAEKVFVYNDKSKKDTEKNKEAMAAIKQKLDLFDSEISSINKDAIEHDTVEKAKATYNIDLVTVLASFMPRDRPSREKMFEFFENNKEPTFNKAVKIFGLDKEKDKSYFYTKFREWKKLKIEQNSTH